MYPDIRQAHFECGLDVQRVTHLPSLLQRGKMYDMECGDTVEHGDPSPHCM